MEQRQATVLIVEDDITIAEAVSHQLGREGLRALIAGDGAQGIRLFRSHRPDLVLVDLMLPQIDGWRFTEWVRTEDMHVPIIITSARTSEHDRVHGLQIGADDYVTKPYSMRELIARIHAHLRRSARGTVSAARETISAHGLRIDPEQIQAFAGERSVGLTPREFEVLYALARRVGKPVIRTKLYREVWGYEMAVGDRSVDVFVRKLRRKLEEALPGRAIINTHYGVGYRFEPDL